MLHRGHLRRKLAFLPLCWRSRGVTDIQTAVHLLTVNQNRRKKTAVETLNQRKFVRPIARLCTLPIFISKPSCPLRDVVYSHASYKYEPVPSHHYLSTYKMQSHIQSWAAVLEGWAPSLQCTEYTCVQLFCFKNGHILRSSRCSLYKRSALLSRCFLKSCESKREFLKN